MATTPAVVSAASLLGSLGIPSTATSASGAPAAGSSAAAAGTAASSALDAEEEGVTRSEFDLRLLFESRRGIRPLVTGPSARIPQRALNSELTCPVCLGIIRDATSVMECLHRFCAACIEKSLRFGKKECPSCRVGCPSRRNLRKDDAFNAVISAIYPDLSKAESAQEAHIQEVIKSYNVRKFGEIASKGARQQRDQAKRSTKRPASPPPSFGMHAAFAAPVAKRPRNPNKPEPISIMLQQHPTLRDADPKLRDAYALPNKFVRTSRYITVLLLKKWLQLKLCKPKSSGNETAAAAAAAQQQTESKEQEANKMEDEAQPDAAAAASSSSSAAAAAAAAPSAAAAAAPASLSSGLPTPIVTPNLVTAPVRFVLYVRAFDLQLLDASPIEQQQQQQQQNGNAPPGQEIYVPLASDLTLDYIEEYMWNSEAKSAQANLTSINAGLAVKAMTDSDPTPLFQKAFTQSFIQCGSHRKSHTLCAEDCLERMGAWHEFLTREQEKFKKYKEQQKTNLLLAASVEGGAASSAAAAASNAIPSLVSLPHKKRRLVIYFSVVGADGQLLTEVPAMAPEVVAKYVITEGEEDQTPPQQPPFMQQQSSSNYSATPMQMDHQTATTG